MLGFVDHQQRLLAGFRGYAGNLGLQGAKGAGPGAFGGQAQLPADCLVGVEHRASAQGHVADLSAPRMQVGDDLAADAGFAAAGFAGEQAEAAQVQQVREARCRFAGGLGGEQLVAVGGRLVREAV